jgi:hypothetical protein
MRVANANANPGFEEAAFRNSLGPLNFALKPLLNLDLRQSDCSPSFPVVPHCGVSKPGQIRDKFEAILSLAGGWLPALLSGNAVGHHQAVGIVSGFNSRQLDVDNLDVMTRLSGAPRLQSRSTSRQVRVRHKNWAGLPFFGGRVAIFILGFAGVASVVSCSNRPGSLQIRQSAEAERARLQEATSQAADRIAAEAHAKLPRSKSSSTGAIYVRFSTLHQDSAIDQIRELFEHAVANKIFVPRENVFFDLGVRGYKSQRAGLD